MAEYTPLGPGTLTLGETPVDYSGEFLGGQITHEYTDVGETRQMLNGDQRAAAQTRADGFTGDVENDLTGAGLYAYLVANDGDDVAFEFTPNTSAESPSGAAITTPGSWNGTVKLRLPDAVGADEYGAPVAGSVTWAAVGELNFVPESAT